MNAQVLSHFPMPWLTCVALVIFFGVFLSVLARVSLKSNAATYRRLENLPLNDDERNPS